VSITVSKLCGAKVLPAGCGVATLLLLLFVSPAAGVLGCLDHLHRLLLLLLGPLSLLLLAAPPVLSLLAAASAAATPGLLASVRLLLLLPAPSSL
jgi:hypothetical protein